MSWKDSFPKQNRYFETENGILYCGDCLGIMREFLDESIDLVVADPPYGNVMVIDWKGSKHNWDIWESRENYLDFIKRVFTNVKRLLKQTGSLYVFQDDKNVAYVQVEIEKLGFYLENHIVWVKTNNMTKKGWTKYRCFTPITERILFFSKEFRTNNLRDLTREQIETLKPVVEYFREQKRKIKEIFNFKTDKEFNDLINKITNTRSIASRHYFTYSQFSFPTKEMYLKLQSINKLIGSQKVFKKEYEEIKKEYEDLRRYFKQEENYTDVWNLPIIGGEENTNHPTQKPIKLIERIVRCSSRENDLVLDPFLGSGTTAVVCEKTNRRWIGIEINPEYCEMAKNRIQELNGRLFNG